MKSKKTEHIKNTSKVVYPEFTSSVDSYSQGAILNLAIHKNEEEKISKPRKLKEEEDPKVFVTMYVFQSLFIH